MDITKIVGGTMEPTMKLVIAFGTLLLVLYALSVFVSYEFAQGTAALILLSMVLANGSAFASWLESIGAFFKS